MIITQTSVKVRDLIEDYRNDDENGVFAYGGKLCVRPSFQREFVYSDKQRDEVIRSIKKKYPLNVIYWSKTGDDAYEVLDGQQRTISICEYVAAKSFSINHQYFFNLTEEEQNAILDYELDVYICDGDESEKLEWFRVINIAGAVLTNQELLNATYTGTWLSDAKLHFSKRNCVASKISDKYLKGNPIRQDYLEKALEWIADRDGLKDKQEYMAKHQHDTDANELWIYFQNVINWAKTLFPIPVKGITDSQEWGILYNQFKDKTYNSNVLADEMKKLIMDDDVTKNSGIVPYLFSEKTSHDEKHLSIRTFSESQKMRAYERQKHKCPYCLSNGVDKEYAFEEMDGDHIVPWSKGGHTTDDNLQMLCRKCNNDKSAK